MKKFLLLLIAGALFSLAFTISANASHITAMDLTYRCLGGDVYEVKLKFYRDCKGIDAPTSALVHFQSLSCNQHFTSSLSLSGPSREVSAVCATQLSNTACNGGSLPGIQEYVYKGTVTLPAKCSDWVISYSDCCRNAAITNLQSPGSQSSYIEANLNNLSVTCNTSPEFQNLPVPYICKGQPFTFNHGAVDADGDSLYYRLIPARSGASSNIGYNAAYTFNSPISSSVPLTLNGQTGEIAFTPNIIQQAVMVIEVSEYRNGKRIGTVMRDLQIIVVNCTNNVPTLQPLANVNGGLSSSNFAVEVCAGQTVSFTINGQDLDAGQILALTSNLSAAIPGATLTPVVGVNPVTTNFSWTTTLADAGLHVFTVTIKDDACAIFGFQTYTISIVVLTGTTAGADKYFCTSGGPVQLNAQGGSVFNWTMLGGGPAVGLSCSNCPSPLASPSVTSTYVVTSNFGFGCTNKDTITVNVVPDFPLSMSPDTNTCQAGKGLVIGAFPGFGNPSSYTYQWTPTTGLNNPNIQTPTVTTSSKVNYICLVTSSTGCVKQDTVTVDVKGQLNLYLTPGHYVETCSATQFGVVLVPTGYIFLETFHEEIDSTNWSGIRGGHVGTNCGAYMNDAWYLNANGPRDLTTKILDVHKGGALTFYIKTGSCRNCICDKPENDDQQEDLVLEYTTDGVTWNLIKTFDADVYAPLTSFQQVTLQIPDAAKTATTQFRWRQLNHNGLNKDMWIVDEITISEGLGTYTYQWTPPNGLTDPTINNPVSTPDTTTTYTVHIVDTETGCVFEDTIKVKLEERIFTQSSPQINYCIGEDSVQFNIQINPASINYVYTWTPANYLSDPTILNPKAMPPVSTNYTLLVEDTVGLCIKRINLRVAVKNNFTLSAGLDTVACMGVPHMLEAVTNPVPHHRFSWTPINNLSDPTLANPILTTTTNGTYYVTAVDTITGCIQKDTVVVDVRPDFDLDFKQSVVFCPYDDSLKVEAAATPRTGYIYQWHDGTNWIASDSVQYLHVRKDTTLYLQVHQPGGCYKADSIKVKVYSGTGINLGVSGDNLIDEEDPAVLTATGALHYRWRPNSLVNDSTASQIISYPTRDTTYTIIGYDQCYADTLTYRVEVNPLEFFIPNLVIKNSPTDNRYFKITNFGKRWNVEIYNRWGKLVFKKDRYTKDWDMDKVEDGMYYYHILDTKIGKEYVGWVHVITATE